MVAPVSGPFTKVAGSASGPFLSVITGYRQKKPYDRPLPLTVRKQYVFGSKSVFVSAAGADYATHADLGDIAHGRCYSKFVDELRKEQAQLAVSLHEWDKSRDLILGRASQLLTFAKQLRSGNFSKALKVLGHPPDSLPRTRKHMASKSLGAQWLELHFGWVPLVQDIQASMKVLEGQPPSSSITTRSSAQSNFPVNANPSVHSIAVERNSFYTTSIQMGGRIRMTNPNLYAASSLGLTNPIEWAWEVIPFSFVVDWFTNASSFLGQWDDFLGVQVDMAYTTVVNNNTFFAAWIPHPTYEGDVPAPDGCKGVLITRSLGITGPRFYVKPYHGFSVARAATAMSLLTQILPKR